MSLKPIKEKKQNAPTADNFYQVRGIGGSVRHQGYFSADNPYFDDMHFGDNNKDIDAAFERAVEWESDRANLLEQRAYDKEVLLEQRAYDHPLAELQRQREAGYNPDIADGTSSGSSGGSSAQLAQREIDDQQPQSKFSNAYDNASLAMQGISTAGNFISSIASGFSSIASGITTLRKLPSDIELSKAQANASTAGARLATSQAGEIDALLKGKQEYQKLTNGGLILDIIMQSTQNGLLTPDSDITPLLSAFDVDESEHQPYKSFYDELKKNPNFIANYNRGKVSANQSSAEASLFTTDYFLRIRQKEQDLHEKQLDFGVIKQSIQNDIAELLNASNYAQDVAESQIVGATSASEAATLSLQKLRYDADVFVKRLGAIKDEINHAENRRLDLLHKEQKEGKLDRRERIELEYLNDAIPMMHTQGSEEYHNFWSIARNVMRNQYISRHQSSGSMNGDGPLLQDLSIYWGDYVNGAKSGNDIANMWTNSIINGIGAIGGLLLGVGVVTKPQSTGTITTNQSIGYDGQMRTDSQQIIQNIY